MQKFIIFILIIVFLSIVSAIFLIVKNRKKRRARIGWTPPLSENEGVFMPNIITYQQPETIFVSVASFRDRLCPRTISGLFERAANPKRVFVGICVQNDDKDQKCDEHSVPKEFKSHVRVDDKISAKQARGPNYARYRCSKLYRGETFFLQIDSHTIMRDNWDVDVLEQYEVAKKEAAEMNLDSSRVLLSHYPPAVSSPDATQITEKRVPFNCKGTWEDNDPWLIAQAVLREPFSKPQPSLLLAAGFIFAPGHFLREIPFDPRLQYLFHGEETLLSARAFTHGWSAFTPTINIAAHWYIRSNEPKVWDLKNWKKSKSKGEGIQIVRGLLKEELKDGYGLGMGIARKLSAFWSGLGVKGPGTISNAGQRSVHVCGDLMRMTNALKL